MSRIEQAIEALAFNRVRTLATLDRIAQEPNAQEVLGWRPGPGRAHLAWQLMHIGITEELFASERLKPEKPGQWLELWPRFRGGSTPDDDIPSLATVKDTLARAREHMLATLRSYDDSRLSEIPASLAARKLTILDVLHIISWHEGHHQGQAHITLNLYKNRGAK